MRRFISLDLETHLIVPGLLTPPIVCGATAEWRDGRVVDARLMDKRETLVEAMRLLEDDDVTLVFANAVFDLGCLCAADASFTPIVFEAYRKKRIWDILIATSLDAVAGGHLGRHPNGGPLLDAKGRQTKRYSLDVCVRVILGREDAKANDFWRLRYAILENVPMIDWPVEAVQYPKDDVSNTVEVMAVQAGLVESKKPFRNLEDLANQCESDWALHLGAIWGLRADATNLRALEALATELHVGYVARFKTFGFFKPDGTEDTAAVARAVAKAYGATDPCGDCGGVGKVRAMKVLPCRGEKVKGRFKGCLGLVCGTCAGKLEVQQLGGVVTCKSCCGSAFDISPKKVPALPRTTKDGISSSRDTLSESGDEDLAEFGDNKFEKVLKTYLPFLRGGLSAPITLSPNVVLESGRVSYDGLVQTFPRWKLEGAPSPRECIRAADGWVLGSTDYAALELVTLSQVCLWVCKKSRMAEAINASKDPGALHTALGAKFMNISFEEMKKRIDAKDKTAKDYRQAAKPCFHPDTEILTRTGWKKIADLSMEDEVAAAQPVEGKICVEILWQQPLALTRRPFHELLHIKNEGIDLRVTPEHRMLVYRNRYRGSRGKKTLEGVHWDVVSASVFGKQRGWANAGVWLGGERVINERLLRLAVAVQADGTYSEAARSATHHIRLRFSKKRKIDRLLSLLEPGEYELGSSKNGERGRTTIFKLSEELSDTLKTLLDSDKTIPWWWIELRPELRLAVLDEVQYWDGNKVQRAHHFFTVIKKNAEVLQAMASLTGLKTRLAPNKPRPKEQVCWSLTIRTKGDTRGESVEVTREAYVGDVVCLSVPSSFVVVRDGGVPVVVGQCNFGLPGGMQAATLVGTSRKESSGSTIGPDGRKYAGIRFCIMIDGAAECGIKKKTEWNRQVIPPTCEACLKLAEDQLIPAWFAQWPEMEEYFAFVKYEVERRGEVPCFGPWFFDPRLTREQRIPHRIRGRANWRSSANNGFQGLAADGAKNALRQVVREAYLDESSPLYQAQVRVPLFAHDELVTTMREDLAHMAGPRIAEVMISAMREWVPDVWVHAETALQKFWDKGAEPVYSPDGKLLVWYSKDRK